MSFSNSKTKKNKLVSMPVINYNSFIDLLKVQASSDNEKMMYHYIVSWLDNEDIPHYTDAEGNLIATKGDADVYPCIASHMDTVHDIVDDFRIFYHDDKKDGNRILTAGANGKQLGIGGDDKCGIYACLYMLESLDVCKAIFFTKEEVGLIGSSTIDHEHFTNIGYIIQLDRWGASDFICKYSGDYTVSDEFLTKALEPMKQYGYKEQSGLITDSINLWDNSIGVSCVNVSCGYYQHHSASEYIDTNEFWNSVLFTLSLMKKLGNKEYVSVPPKPIYKSTDKYFKKWGSYNEFDYTKDDFDEVFDEYNKPLAGSEELLYDNIDWDAADWDVVELVLADLLIDSASLYDILMESREADSICYEYFLRTNQQLYI